MSATRALALATLVPICAALACNGIAESEAAPARRRVPPLQDAGPSQQGLKAHMKDHFQAVKDIQSAIVGGDLRLAKKRAKWLAEHETHDALATWAVHIQVMKRAAREVIRAANLDQAAQSTARLGGQCASCHESLTAIVTFEWIAKPSPQKGDVKGHMALHQWAGQRMWEGLVGPSHGQWGAGAEALASDPLHPGEIDGTGKASKEVARLAERVHRLGERARSARETPERVAIYSELLSTCAACHQLTRK